MKETNIEAVLEVVEEFMNIDLEVDEDFPFIIHHPFFTSPAATIKTSDGMTMIDIVNNKEGFIEVKRQMLDNMRKYKSIRRIFMLVSNGYRRTFFKYIKDYLSDKDYAESLKTIWQKAESPHHDVNVSINELLSWFEDADKNLLMDKEEQEEFNNLENEITIYRGFGHDGYHDALSWTTDIEVARFFANRKGSDGVIYAAEIDKDDIICKFSYEDEVIVDYKKLRNIRVL